MFLSAARQHDTTSDLQVRSPSGWVQPSDKIELERYMERRALNRPKHSLDIEDVGWTLARLRLP